MNGGLSQYARVLASVDPALLRKSASLPVPAPSAGLAIPPGEANRNDAAGYSPRNAWPAASPFLAGERLMYQLFAYGLFAGAGLFAFWSLKRDIKALREHRCGLRRFDASRRSDVFAELNAEKAAARK